MRVMLFFLGFGRDGGLTISSYLCFYNQMKIDLCCMVVSLVLLLFHT